MLYTCILVALCTAQYLNATIGYVDNYQTSSTAARAARDGNTILLTVGQTFTVPDFSFIPDSTLDIATGTEVIYALDWCQQNPGSLKPPLLAAGGSLNDTRSCTQSNIFVYSLDNICQVNAQGPINPRIVAITEGTFDSGVVNAIRWCQPSNSTCPVAPYLAVGGQTSGQAPMTNIRIYYIDSVNYTLNSLSYAPINSLASINAIDWNPECNCSTLTVGGCQQDGNTACNIVAYNGTTGGLLNTVEQTLFDTNVTSLDWCKTNTIPATLYAYLAIGTTGTTPCAGGLDESDQIVVYKAVFCKNANNPSSPCNR
jgi:hypothetical protein